MIVRLLSNVGSLGGVVFASKSAVIIRGNRPTVRQLLHHFTFGLLSLTQVKETCFYASFLHSKESSCISANAKFLQKACMKLRKLTFIKFDAGFLYSISRAI